MEMLAEGVAFGVLVALQFFSLKLLIEVRSDTKRINGTVATHTKEIDRLRDKLDS